MSHQTMGTLLLFTALAVIAGMAVNSNHLWLVIDLFVILVCGICGIMLLRKK